MTTGPTETRLDRIEAAIGQLVTSQVQSQQQINTLVNYLDADRIRQEKFKADIQSEIREGFETAGSLIADLAVQVGAITQRIDRMAEQAAADRQQAERDRQDWQERIEQIWVYLRSKDCNGHSKAI